MKPTKAAKATPAAKAAAQGGSAAPVDEAPASRATAAAPAPSVAVQQQRAAKSASQPQADSHASAEIAQEASVESDEGQPMNRAERRAKGRGKTVAQSGVPVHGKVSGGHGPAHTQRNWANRRSG